MKSSSSDIVKGVLAVLTVDLFDVPMWLEELLVGDKR